MEEEKKEEETPEVEEDKVDVWKADFAKFFKEMKIDDAKAIDE